MTNPQGTRWESEIVSGAQGVNLPADRYPKRGQKGEPDLWIGHSTPDKTIGVLFWKRLVGKKGDGPRQPDGERRVVVVEYNDFLELIAELDESSPIRHRIEVQAKWTKALNVTRVLGELRSWMKENYLTWLSH
jgi:hypothetical protein